MENESFILLEVSNILQLAGWFKSTLNGRPTKSPRAIPDISPVVTCNKTTCFFKLRLINRSVKCPSTFTDINLFINSGKSTCYRRLRRSIMSLVNIFFIFYWKINFPSIKTLRMDSLGLLRMMSLRLCCQVFLNLIFGFSYHLVVIFIYYLRSCIHLKRFRWLWQAW